MKYSTGKYGTFLYGIWRGAETYIRAAVTRATALAVNIFDSVRARATARAAIEIEAAVIAHINIDGDTISSTEVDV